MCWGYFMALKTEKWMYEQIKKYLSSFFNADDFTVERIENRAANGMPDVFLYWYWNCNNDPEKFRIQSELATLVDVNFNDGRKGHCFIENKSLLTKKSTIRKTAHQRPWHLDYLSKGNICFYLLYDNKEMNWGIHVEDLEFIAWYDNLTNIFDELLASNSMNDFKKRIFNE